MTDMKKQFESRALIAEELLLERTNKLAETESILKTTKQSLEDLQIEHEKLKFMQEKLIETEQNIRIEYEQATDKL